MAPYLTHEEFQKYLRGMQEISELTVDTEGTLNHPFSETWGLSTSAFGIAQYFAFNHQFGENLPREWLPEIAKVIEGSPCLIMHNAKHDLRALRNLGINYTGPFKCTMLRSHMVDENRYSTSLDNVSRLYGGQPKQMSELMKTIVDGFGYKYVPVELWPDYATNDAFITEEASHSIDEEFNDQFDDNLWDWEQEFVRLLIDIEDEGVLIDKELCEKELKRGLQIMKDLRRELGFNPGSPVELGNFLINELGLPPVGEKGKSGRYSFKKAHMERYDEMLEARGDKRAKQVLAYRGWAKTTSSNYKPYLTRLGPDGRLRTDYRQDVAVTGRLTASLLHQIPRLSPKDWNGNLKAAIITEEGRTGWEADYSQLELRVGAIYAKERKLLDVFNDSVERDIFDEMSKELSMARDPVKTLNYTMQFGGGWNRISEVFNVSPSNAKSIINSYFNTYPGLRRITELAKYRAGQNGYVRYWTGRRRHFKHKDEYRKAFNALCQGGAFEIVKRQGIKLKKAGVLTDECRMDLTVHDSYRFSIENGKEDKYLPEIKRIMEDVDHPLLNTVNFKVNIKKWGEK